MQRTLISRGLAAVFVVAAALAAAVAPASACAHVPVVVTGSWVDPGQVIDSITPLPDGTTYRVALHGGTEATGGFTGTSTYKMVLRYDSVTSDSVGWARETYTASVAGHGQGHVTFGERVTIDGATGAILVAGHVVAGDGVFRNVHGYGRFTGAGDPSGGRSTGTYKMWLDLAR